MSKFKAILSLLAGNIIKDLAEFGDKNFTSREEMQQALTERDKVWNERLQIVASMTDDHDSWLSKNVRPLCLLIVLGTLSVIMVFDIQVNQDLLNKYMNWTGIIVGFYFGAREVVKLVKRKKNS